MKLVIKRFGDKYALKVPRFMFEEYYNMCRYSSALTWTDTEYVQKYCLGTLPEILRLAEKKFNIKLKRKAKKDEPNL